MQVHGAKNGRTLIGQTSRKKLSYRRGLRDALYQLKYCTTDANRSRVSLSSTKAATTFYSAVVA